MSDSSRAGNGHGGVGPSSAPGGTSLTRRSLLVGGGLTTLLGFTGAPAPAWGSKPTRGALHGFDVSAPSTAFLRQKRTRDATVMQTFAFDDTNQAVYVAQVTQGGRQLTGESAPVSGSQRLANGDNTVSLLDYGGNLRFWMYLRGWGHPVALGVEPIGSDVYLWFGTDSVTNSSGVGYGRQIGRVRFAHNTVVDYPSTAIEVHNPVPGSQAVSVSLDTLNRTLLMRAYVNGGPRYYLYGLDAFRAHNYSPVYDRAETGIKDVFQGQTHYFDQVYRVEGGSGGVTAAPTYLSHFDLPTGTMTQRSLNTAASDLTFREPQGISVQRSPLRLHMGIADGVVGDRNISLYYQDRYTA